MDSRPLLAEIGRQISKMKIEAILIGNAAAALQGAPVTTLDFDFLFRKTPRNIVKLKGLAEALGATVMRPFYPASEMYRVVRDRDGLQLDFMGAIHGVRSFEGVRDRATVVKIDDVQLLVADLADIIRSKKAAKRPQDLAVLDLLEKAREEREAAAQSAKAPRRGRARK